METPPIAPFPDGLSADDVPTPSPPAVRPSREGEPPKGRLRLVRVREELTFQG